MALWFETKIKYEKMMERGNVKKVTEPYLVDALTVSEAEQIAIDKMTSLISGEFNIPSVKETKIAEIFNMDADKFYLVKCGFVQMDEKTGAEKRAISEILVGASDFEEALATFKNEMKGTMADYEIVSIAETSIVEVFPHNN